MDRGRDDVAVAAVAERRDHPAGLQTSERIAQRFFGALRTHMQRNLCGQCPRYFPIVRAVAEPAATQTRECLSRNSETRVGEHRVEAGRYQVRRTGYGA